MCRSVKVYRFPSHSWCTCAGGGVSRSSSVDTNSSVQRLLRQFQHDAQVLGMAFLCELYQVWSCFITGEWKVSSNSIMIHKLHQIWHTSSKFKYLEMLQVLSSRGIQFEKIVPFDFRFYLHKGMSFSIRFIMVLEPWHLKFWTFE